MGLLKLKPFPLPPMLLLPCAFLQLPFTPACPQAVSLTPGAHAQMQLHHVRCGPLMPFILCPAIAAVHSGVVSQQPPSPSPPHASPAPASAPMDYG